MKIAPYRFLLPVIFIVGLSRIFSQQPYFPDSNWQIEKPSEVKMNAALIESAASSAAYNETKTDEYDVCIYGGTSAGVIAAYSVAKMGKTVLLTESGKHLGGLSSG